MKITIKSVSGIILVLLCGVSVFAQGGSNPPTEIKRGINGAQIDVSGNFYVDLATGKVIRVKSTCSGATVSGAGEASICYDNTASPKAVKISVNGSAYSSLLTAATAPATTPGGAPNAVQFNNTGTFEGIDDVTSDGTALYGKDSSLIITGSADTTKQARFEIDGFTAGQTRVFTLPNAGGTIALTSNIPTLGSNVATFLATPSSANLRGALTDESGTGVALFAGGNIGAATGASLTVTGSVTAPLFASTPQTLTDAATVTWDLNAGQYATVTLGGNRTLSITNSATGKSGCLAITQDGTGGRTLTLPGGSKVSGGGAGAVTLSSAGGTVDVLCVLYIGSTPYFNLGANYN